MVKKLSKADQTALKEAVKKAERRTTAEISFIVAPASSDYRDFILMYGFILGSLLALGLWGSATLGDYSLLLAVQTVTILAVDAVPWLRDVCIKLVPRYIRHERAARDAMREYHNLHAEIPSATPFVLLYVSLSECYVHVVTNPVVHKKIPGKWTSVTGHFTNVVRKHGIRAACSEALQRIADILAEEFPNK